MLGSIQDADLKLLRVFHAIVENGGFSAAQVILNVSASRISTQMSELESRLGVRLCDRGRVGFALTPEGRAVYEESLKLFLAVEDFRLKLSEQQSRLAGEIRLGLIDNLTSNAAARVPQAIARFKQRDNDVNFDLRIEPALELEAGVMEGRLHLAMGYFHHRINALHYRPMLREVHYLYCGRHHPLFDRSDKDISTQALLDCDYANRRDLENEGELASDFGRRGSASSDNMEALTVLILSGSYLAFLPQDCAQVWVDRGDIRPIRPDTFYQRATLHLITRKGVAQPRAVMTFEKDLLDEHESEMQA